jgi:polysaccharide biosynthesis protein PslG
MVPRRERAALERVIQNEGSFSEVEGMRSTPPRLSTFPLLIASLLVAAAVSAAALVPSSTAGSNLGARVSTARGESPMRWRSPGSVLQLGRAREAVRFPQKRQRSASVAPARPALGVQFHCNWAFYTNADRMAVLDKLKAAGVGWVRIDAAWSGIEAAHKGDRNPWYIRMVDFCVKEAHKRGIKVLVTLWMTPGWANGGASTRVPPANPQDYADFARWAAMRWRGRVSAWEVWNEPDPWQSFFRGNLPQYVNLLKAAYPAFKAGDPNALVLLGGPSSNDDRWVDQVYALGAKGSFDVLATHPYQGIADAPPESADDGNRWWFTHLPAVRKVMLRHGDGAKPIWFTEFGWSAHVDRPGIANWQRGVTPEQQGDYLVRAMRYTRAHYPYVPVMFWYKERARASGDAHQEGYALLNSNLSERPVYKALKNFLSG